MTRWEYFLKRLVLSIPVLFMATTFVFVMLRMGPIDPVAARFGQEADRGDAARMREELGLNDPLWEQYLDFMTDYLVPPFDFGQSWVVRSDQDVIDVLVNVAPATLWLGFWAILLPLFIGIPLGFYAGLNSNSLGDYAASFSGIVWLALPNFWLCVIALAALRRTRGGDGPFGFDWYTFGPELNSITGSPDLGWFATTDLLFLPVPYVTDLTELLVDIKLILPAALILGSASMAAELRLGRSAMLETVNKNFVETARAKGLRGRVIVWKHIFRNSLIPLLPVITSEATLLIGGSVIVEQIFNINGIGRVYYLAIVNGDLPLAGALLIIFSVLVLGLNILQDFLYTVIDPRVGYES